MSFIGYIVKALDYYLLNKIFQIILFWSIFYEKHPEIQNYHISCSRNKSTLVREFIAAKWLPILNKYRMELPYDCPFHPQRDLFKKQESAKHEHRANQWACRYCGKIFLSENDIDNHFGKRHMSTLNVIEDSICYEKYCDYLRCNVLVDKFARKTSATIKITDVELWDDKKVLKFYKTKQDQLNLVSASEVQQQHNLKDFNKTKSIRDASDTNKSSFTSKSAHNYQRRLEGANECVPSKLEVLRKNCERIVSWCLGPLLINMSSLDFKLLEDEIHRSTCWYLTCDRYWEDNITNQRPFPWILSLVLVVILSLGICMCYYIIWIAFGDSTSLSTKSYATNQLHVMQENQANSISPGSLCSANSTAGTNILKTNQDIDSLIMDQNEHYIYITYPTDPKRKVIENFYNRTTHL